MSTEIQQPPVPFQDDATSRVEDVPVFTSNISHPEAAANTNSSEKSTSASSVKVEDEHRIRQIQLDQDEGVEVVLDGTGSKTTVVDSVLSRPSQDQNVFRAPHPVRPRAVRGGRPPHPHASGSYGYGHPPQYGGHHAHGRPPSHGDYRQGPYPVSYAQSGSFDHQDGVSVYPGAPPTSHYSPHVQYPPPGARRPEDVNVISPNHKDHHPHQHHPHGARSGASGSRYPPSGPGYHYPPQSPVSRPGGHAVSSPPRMRGYGRHTGYPTPDRSRPPLVTESSFDSDYYSSHASHSSPHPTTPNAPHYGPPPHSSNGHHDPHYGYGGSFEGSFDSHHPPHGGHHQGYYDERSHYHSPSHPYSEHSPYSSHSYGYSPSAGSYYDPYSPYAGHYGRHPRSYDEQERYHHYYGHPDYEHGLKKDEKSGMILPKAASEVDFEVTDPPMEPITPASTEPVCETPADVNSYDVLCGRGGGTNSQIGNRRFRKLVQDFQPIYLLARRKEKPLLARTIVLIIRKRGGRFLKKDEETGELYEVGDAKAEAKTSQALREGLDVRATKSAASSLMDKKKKKSSKPGDESDSVPDSHTAGEEDAVSPSSAAKKSPTKEGDDAARSDDVSKTSKDRSESPPTLPKLHGEVVSSSKVTEAPPSPEQMQFRKRRRMRSADGDVTTSGCGVNPFSGDKLFPDFCPPRADLARTASPPPRGSEDHHMDVGITPIGARGGRYDDDDIRYEQDTPGATSAGCAGIALDMMTGAAAGSFCLGPREWR
ncbi:hypothetical protein IV203_029102 [Nitzschia inconspicua]|uniref:DUF6824 domain-containing protein n=1 Tax=Nitzschia inconspicua TaxID=303405 RepID=A0A9K3Q026_9STRA|nr:hypothetical protein IV203_029102 [Nitzschia inconspicua]